MVLSWDRWGGKLKALGIVYPILLDDEEAPTKRDGKTIPRGPREPRGNGLLSRGQRGVLLTRWMSESPCSRRVRTGSETGSRSVRSRSGSYSLSWLGWSRLLPVQLDQVVAIGQRLEEYQRSHDRADRLRAVDVDRRLDKLEATVGDIEEDTQVQTREQLTLRAHRAEAEAERLRTAPQGTPGSVSIARWQAIGVIVAAALTGGGGVLLARVLGGLFGN